MEKSGFFLWKMCFFQKIISQNLLESLSVLLTAFYIILADFLLKQKSISTKKHLFSVSKILTFFSFQISIFPRGGNKFRFTIIYFLDYTTIYYAVNNGIDPTPVEAIDFIKRKRSGIKNEKGKNKTK